MSNINLKKKKILLIIIILIIIPSLLIYNKYRTIKMSEALDSISYFESADKLSVEITEFSTYDNKTSEYYIEDEKIIKQILEYINDFEVRRNMQKTRGTLTLKDIELNFTSSSGSEEVMIKLIGDDYIGIRLNYNEEIFYKFVNQKIDLNEVIDILGIELQNQI